MTFYDTQRIFFSTYIFVDLASVCLLRLIFLGIRYILNVFYTCRQRHLFVFGAFDLFNMGKNHVHFALRSTVAEISQKNRICN